MGLDIHAASHLRHVGPMPSEEELDRLEEALEKEDKYLSDAYFLMDENPEGFEQHMAGMKTGLYELSHESEEHSFRAGPYSYYNDWRRHLCLFALKVPAEDVWADPDQFAGKPFVELINFTDCDGRIGTTVAAKLAQDFRSHFSQAEAYAHTLSEMKDWLEVYVDFLKAFELAAQDGALKFC